MNRNQSGFSAIMVVIALIIIGVIGWGALYVLQNNKEKTSSHQTSKTKTSNSETVPTENKQFTGEDAASLVQEVYDLDYARWERNQAKQMNNETVSETEQDRISLYKDKLSSELQAKLLAPYSGGVPHDRINCSHAIMAGKYTAALTSVSEDVANVTVTASYTGDYAQEPPYYIATTVDMKTEKLTSITCP